MRRRIILAGALAVLPAVVMAQDKKNKSLQDRLQGVWVRPSNPYSFEVKGNRWFHFEERLPFKATETGVIQFPAGKDYAIVHTSKGHKWWLFSAGEDAIGAEVFEPDGSLHPSSDGRMYYRMGTAQP